MSRSAAEHGKVAGPGFRQVPSGSVRLSHDKEGEQAERAPADSIRRQHAMATRRGSLAAAQEYHACQLESMQGAG